jgi:beta-xylosidase
VLLAACSGGAQKAEPPTSTSTSTSATTTTLTTRSTTPATTATTATTSTTVPAVAIPAGPVFPRDFPDPFVLWTGDEYHATATTSGLVNIQHLDSDDFSDWVGPGELLASNPSWATPLSTWAPALLSVGDRRVLYFTAQVAGTKMHCISAAVATSLDGPFHDDSAEPLLCPRDRGGAIDPSPFVDVDGSLWLLWKNDGITLRRESAIWSQRLTDDGLGLVGDPIELIGTDQDWEYPHVEAPSMTRIGAAYWMLYSGNWWNSPAYGIGLARCEGPSGPCTKPFDHAVVTATPGAEGPGGGEFFVDASGRLLVAYHAWLGKPGYPGHRALFLAPVDVTADPPVIEANRVLP